MAYLLKGGARLPCFPGEIPADQTTADLAMGSMMTPNPPKAGKRVKAFLLADRIDTSNLQHDGVVSTAPLTYRFGTEGFVTLFRYGVAVTMCLSRSEENEVLNTLRTRL